ncbi:MAG: sensor domain-containing diguanylate cyclase [Deltaproteobacteria bacterium]|nr:sensor domain-containing diguanylate cyclase [Deltaproteobacteria bacterium]
MPRYQISSHPGAPRVAALDADAASAQGLVQVLEDAGFAARAVLTPEGLANLVLEWHPHVVIIAEAATSILRAVRAAGGSAQVVILGETVPDASMLAAFGVHAWGSRSDPPARLLATIESATRRQREVAGLHRQRAGLQRILDVSPRLNTLRSPAEFCRVSMEAFARTVDPDGTETSGIFAIQTQHPRHTQYYGGGRWSRVTGELDLPDDVVDAIAKAMGEKAPIVHGEGWVMIAVNGGEHARGALVIDGASVPVELDEMCAVFGNLLGQALANIVLFNRATLDGLTGLFNRAFGLQRLLETLSMAARASSDTAVLLVDVDHFKQVNDRYGHATGDRVLAGVAQTIRSCCRDTDIAARLGGEEFMVVLPRTDERSAGVVAERLRRSIEGWRSGTDAHGLHVSVSIGVAAAEPGERDALRLVERADDALYVAKREGRNRVMRAG